MFTESNSVKQMVSHASVPFGWKFASLRRLSAFVGSPLCVLQWRLNWEFDAQWFWIMQRGDQGD